MGGNEENTGSVRRKLFEAVSPKRAFELLLEGNARYTGDVMLPYECTEEVRRELALRGQRPFACVLGCSDSRVPPEIVFDVGPGEIFVVRTAGNVADDIVIGSVEYAAAHLHVPLVVVLGHSLCGAVAAAVSGEAHGFITAVVGEIKPSLDIVRREGEDNIFCRCEDENIKHTISKLKKSDILGKLLSEGKLNIIGAKYDTKTGVVKFGQEFT